MLCFSCIKAQKRKRELSASDYILRLPWLILSKPRTTDNNIPVISINMQVQKEQKGKFLSAIIFQLWKGSGKRGY